jgi:hypothetical protein
VAFGARRRLGQRRLTLFLIGAAHRPTPGGVEPDLHGLEQACSRPRRGRLCLPECGSDPRHPSSGWCHRMARPLGGFSLLGNLASPRGAPSSQRLRRGREAERPQLRQPIVGLDSLVPSLGVTEVALVKSVAQAAVVP